MEIRPEMEIRFDDDKRLRLYLLGLLPPTEQNRIEEWLLAGPTQLERLLLVEEELIDSYVCGELSPHEQTQFESYFLSTPEQCGKLRLAKSLRRYATTKATSTAPADQTAPSAPSARVKQSFRALAGWRRFSAPALAAVILLSLGAGVWWKFFSKSEYGAAQVALKNAYRDWRTHESRVTGFDYAPLDQRRAAASADSGYVAHEHVELLIRSLVQKERNAASLHLLGRLYLVKKEFNKAIEQLQAARVSEPGNARIYNDLGAATLEKAKTIRAADGPGARFALAGECLEYLNKALELDSSLDEALFNRALCFELLKNFPRAKQDWESYLKRDSSSAWAEEAQRHLAKITQQGNKPPPTNEQLRSVFEQALRAGDEESAWQALSRGRSQTGNSVVEQLADDILTRPPNAAHADDALQSLKQAGALEAYRVKDRFTSDLAHYYAAASPTQRAASVRARTLVKLGHARRAKSVGEAVELYQEAGRIFNQAGNSCEASLADLYSGKNLIWSSRLDEAVALLQRLARLVEEREFLWLQAQALAQLGHAHLARNQFSETFGYLQQAIKVAERIRDQDAQADCLVSLANTHYFLGDHRVPLGYLEQYADLASESSLSKQVSWRNCQLTSFNFASLGWFSAALEYQQESLRLAEELQVPVIKARTYTFLGWLYGELGKYDEGIHNIEEAIKLGQSNQADPVGRNIIAHSSLRLGNLYRLTGQFDKALACYDQQFVLAEQMNAPFYSYGAHQGKFLAYAAQNNVAAAREELQVALELFEKYRAEIVQENIKNSFFDTGQEVYDAAIRFAYSALGDPRLAFEYAEISRARSLLDVLAKPAARTLTFAEVQARLPNDVQIVQYAVLDDALITWVITPDAAPGEVKYYRYVMSASALADKINQYLRLVSSKPQPSQPAPVREAAELYDILIKPIRPLLRADKQLCIIPDKSLCYLPFGALLSSETKQYLLEEFAVSVASSASTFLFYTEAARAKGAVRRESLLSVGDPDFDRARFPNLDLLAAAEDEARKVARYYSRARVITGAAATEANVRAAMARAEVIHFAAHALADERSGLNSALVLATDRVGEQTNEKPETDGLLHAYEIYDSPLSRAHLVILSACRSGIEPFRRGEGMIGLARPFLAAGAPLVVSSLWPVDSEATSDLMIRFHKYRKQAKLPTAQALRRAQRELLHDGTMGYQHPFYWAAFSAVGGSTKA